MSLLEQSKMVELQLKSKGYFVLPYPKNLAVLAKQLEYSWMKFCSQEDSFKEIIPFGENGGYENKNKKGARDKKENFHITWDYKLPSYLYASPIEEELFSRARKLLSGIKSQISLVANITNEIFGKNKNPLDLGMLGYEGLVLRLLHYYPNFSLDNLLAHQHVDKGGWTYTLFESLPGLEVFWEGEWSSVAFDKGMLVFSGIQGQHFYESEIKALCHRVVIPNHLKNQNRYSAVLFNEFSKYPL
ncbi:MAG: 2OG-Fe(II) oxygenase family protein [Patescibacteria group bacterium]